MADPQAPLLTPEQFAQTIKAKYPDYADVPDRVLAAKMLEKYPEYRDRVAMPGDAPSDATGLEMFGAAKAAPTAAYLAEQAATSPGLPRGMATAGRVLGALAPPIVGGYEAGPVGALTGLMGAANGSWAGGKTGYFSGRLLQNIAGPIANALTAVEPFAQALSTLSGAQGVDDLAQMADPKRTDIGVLGVGLGGAKDPAHPALLNLLAMKTVDAVRYLMTQWASATQAHDALVSIRAAAQRAFPIASVMGK